MYSVIWEDAIPFDLNTEYLLVLDQKGTQINAYLNGEALFEVAKPLQKMGIGVDQIPTEIQQSKILTGNHLGMLGNVEQLPDETTVNDYKLTELSEMFIEHEDDGAALETALHQHAKQLLDQGQVEDAWKTLLAYND